MQNTRESAAAHRGCVENINPAALAALLLIVSMTGCASLGLAGSKSGTGGLFSRPGASTETEPDQRKTASLGTIFGNSSTAGTTGSRQGNRVAEAALSFVGASALTVGGQTFPYDCTGLVRAAYWSAGVDIAQDFGEYTGNGVTRIYKTLESKRLLHSSAVPAPGDLVFWDNTYDSNEDGRWNDPLTHVAIVVKIHDDGKIEYVHENYRKGIVVEYMNLRQPDTHTKTVAGRTVIVNSPMRMRGQVTTPQWLSSHLFREFGKAHLLK